VASILINHLKFEPEALLPQNDLIEKYSALLELWPGGIKIFFENNSRPSIYEIVLVQLNRLKQIIFT
jgi:hypothetical protein